MSRANDQSFWQRLIWVYSVASTPSGAGRSCLTARASTRGPVAYLRMRSNRKQFGWAQPRQEFWFLMTQGNPGSEFPEFRQKLLSIRLLGICNAPAMSMLARNRLSICLRMVEQAGAGAVVIFLSAILP